MTTFCLEPDCGALVDSGRCPAHTRAKVDPTYARASAWYRSARWRRLRGVVLRAMPFCVACRAAGRQVLTVDVDHVIPHRGDPALFWDPANLQGLCRSCHTHKTRRGA